MKRLCPQIVTVFLVVIMLAGCLNTEMHSSSTKGYGGDVTVELTVNNGVVEKITATGDAETPNLGGAAIEKYNTEIFPLLEGTDLTDLSFYKLDTVSGASYTSAAVRNAAKTALRKARGEDINRTPVADSDAVYQVIGHSLTTKMNVQVRFYENELKEITVKENEETSAILQSAIDLMIPRILGRQSLAVDSITGATVSSNAIKSAVAVAIDTNGGDSSEWYTPISKSNKTVTIDGYDVIVVGLGGAGMSAYISAAENGATVFGLDSAGKIGGTSTNVSGPMAINPPDKMKTENNGQKWLNEEDLIEDWVSYTHGDAKESLIRKFVYESGETMDWLVRDHEFSFGPLKAFFHPKRWVVWAYYTGDKDTMYTRAINNAVLKDDKNDYMLELTATDLITQDDKVVGVKAEYFDGSIYEIYGDSVILATGGFIGNAEMKEKYIGGNYNVKGMMQDNGAGIQMAMDVGAATYNIDMPPMVHIAQTKTLITNDDLDPHGKAVLTSLVLKSDAMITNADGKRYMNEAGNIAFDNWKGGPVYYSIYSQSQISEYANSGMSIAPNPRTLLQGSKVEANVPIEDMENILKVGADYGIVVKADTMEALAEKLGAPELVRQANEYSSYSETGNDPFGKDNSLIHPLINGPFYAVLGAGYTYGTCGGLDIDEKFQCPKN